MNIELIIDYNIDILIITETWLSYTDCPLLSSLKLIKLRQLLRRLKRKYASSRLDSDLIAYKACRSLYKNKLLSTNSSYFTDILGSYGISSKQAYKLSSP